MSFFISDALAQAAAGAPAQDQLLGLLFPIGLVALLYFLLIRPQAKRQKEHEAGSSLAKGDEVVTVGGIAGRITDLGDNFVQVEIAEGVQVKVRRPAVEAVLPKGSLKDL